MKFNPMDLLSNGKHNQRVVLLSMFTVVIVTITPLYYFPYPFRYATSLSPSSSPPPPPPGIDLQPNDTEKNVESYQPPPLQPPPPPPPLQPPPPPPLRPAAKSSRRTRLPENCDISKGEWERNPEGPYYTNVTCWMIQEHQNCIKYGRPDTDFLKWRWKPDGCELPLFDPALFLELMRGKSMAFVGDSLARNQMQSLMCLLSRVEYPKDVSNTSDENFKRMFYTTYNFTLTSFWSPFLVKAKETELDGLTLPMLWNLNLDEANDDWIPKIERFDYVIISGGNWFTRPSLFYENGRLIGSNYFLKRKIPVRSLFYGHRKAFRTALEAINRLKRFKGVVFLRTISPSHFENGVWNNGGDCTRKKPFRRNETKLLSSELKLYKDQIAEFKRAQKKGKKRGMNFRLLDITQATLLRPDGHPSHFGRRSQTNVTWPNDCVHWCLPGPVDVWNDVLFQFL